MNAIGGSDCMFRQEVPCPDTPGEITKYMQVAGIEAHGFYVIHGAYRSARMGAEYKLSANGLSCKNGEAKHESSLL